MRDFKGQWVHPQHWPQELDCTGKRVVVIGSGATAATLIPSLADAVAHVTMLQRSPTFSRRILPSIRWRPSCANWACAPTGCTRSCGAPSSPRWTAKFACPSNIPRKCARGSSSRRARSCPRASTWRSISTRAIAHGSNASRWFPTATCSPPSAPARRQWSPTASSASTPRASGWSAARILTPTSSSPRRVSTCGYSAACHFSLMANRWTSPSASAIAA